MDNKLTFTNKQQPAQAGKHSVRMPRLRRFVSYLLPGRYHGTNRALYYSMALLIFLTAITPAVQMFVDHSVYNLGAKANALVGTPNENLARKFSYNPDTKTYVFNEKQKVSEDSKIPVEVQLMQHKLGGGGKDDKTLYSVDLPEDLTKGMTYYDNNLGLSFDLVPKFTTGKGKLEQNRLVYVNPDGGPKMVFTAMNNGLKEDMVFDEAPLNPDQTWQYKLNLPDTLAARTMSDGGVGIYSADPSLYKNVSFSGDMDEEKIKSARTSGEKSNLVFAIPAPIIKQSGNTAKGNPSASFVLSRDGTFLTVDATGIDSKLAYPLTVDPSVVITSTSDFATGNNEGNIDYPTDQITGGEVTGGSIGSWASTTAFGSARSHPSSVAYNGYMYIMGGYNGSYLNDVRYALLNSNGTINGSWNTTSSFTTGRENHTSVVYNGYMYVMGGYNGSFLNDVQYAPINANGTLGTWATTTAFTNIRESHTSVVYNGYLYIIGGNFNGTYVNTVHYAPIKADGTVGAWAATSTFTTARRNHASVVYNGYVYLMGGFGVALLNDVQYAPINANGTLGTWATTAAFTTTRQSLTSVVYNGYLYVIGGVGGTFYNDVQYAPINANGSVEAWTTTSAFTTARANHASVAHNGYLYVMGGDAGAGFFDDIQYSAIDSPGVTRAYGTANAFTTARESHASVAYNGYLYVIGGTNGTRQTSIQYAALNANGTVGTWAATTALPVAIQQHAAVAYNKKLYVIGGNDVTDRVDDIRRVDINANGTLGGTWTSTTFTTVIDEHAAVAYNGYMYVIGGFVSGAPTYVPDVRYASINATTGALGAWTDTTDVSGARQGHTAVVYNSRIYVLGGFNGTTELADVQYSTIATNGTLGGWTSTTAFDDSRNDHTTVVYNGYMYVMGGHTGSAMSDTVQYARLNTDGSVDSWSYIGTLPSARDDHTGVVYNGFLYAIGGTNATPTYLSEVRYAKINNHSGLTDTWGGATSFATARYGHTSVALNGYTYIMGGYSTINESNVQKGTLNATTGAVTWTAVGVAALPAGRTYAAAATYNGYIYVTGGGDNAAARYDTVYYAKPDASGNIASWSSGTVFSGAGPARHRHTSVAHNGYLYVIGGSNGTTYYDTVLYAPLNATTGAVGTWATTTSFTTVRHRHSSVVFNGYLYVLGGTNETTDYSDVQFAQLASDGTITGGWNYTTSLGTQRHSMPTIAYNGYLYVVGGRDGGSAWFGDVQIASINTNGTIGEWQKSTSLATARQGHTSVVYNGYLYVMGGSNGANLATVEKADINVSHRVGKYTKLIDIGHATISGITYNGSLANGADDITYRVADDTAVFGATVYSSDTVPAGMPAVCVDSSTTPTRYLLLTITLDESTQAGFPDSLASNSNVTDVTVLADGLRAPTNMRLAHGKWFKSQVQQPLDTCAT